MNTVLSRANTIFAFTLSVLAALTFGCFLTTAFKDNITTVHLDTSKHLVKSTYTPHGEKSDRGHFYFDLNVDLNPLFNWNTKQLFLYLTAEYETKNNIFSPSPYVFPLDTYNKLSLCESYFGDTDHHFSYLKKLNQVVLWDKIIKRGNKAKLDYKSLSTKYTFFDNGNGLRGNKNITLTLSWNLIPNAGILPMVYGDGSTTFSFPDDYTTQKL